jgi:hypothetical protein
MYPNQNSKFNFNPGQFWTTGSWHQIVNYDVMHKHTYVLALAFASFTNIMTSQVFLLIVTRVRANS